MTQNYNNTVSRKGKHLSYSERCQIAILKKEAIPDGVVGFSRKHELFEFAIIPGTTALYQWIDRGIMRTKSMDLLEKLSRKFKAVRPGHRPTGVFSGRLFQPPLCFLGGWNEREPDFEDPTLDERLPADNFRLCDTT